MQVSDVNDAAAKWAAISRRWPGRRYTDMQTSTPTQRPPGQTTATQDISHRISGLDWTAIGVSLRLATCTTIILFLAGMPLAYWLNVSRWRPDKVSKSSQ